MGENLKLYRHLLRMEDNRWPKKIQQWTPHGRSRRGRLQQSGKSQVTDFMRSSNMEEERAEDRQTSLTFVIDRRLSDVLILIIIVHLLNNPISVT